MTGEQDAVCWQELPQHALEEMRFVGLEDKSHGASSDDFRSLDIPLRWARLWRRSAVLGEQFLTNFLKNPHAQVFPRMHLETFAATELPFLSSGREDLRGSLENDQQRTLGWLRISTNRTSGNNANLFWEPRSVAPHIDPDARQLYVCAPWTRSRRTD